MKMNYHKIPGIEKNICTAEQKIAYNIAFTININHGDDFLKIPSQFEKSNAIYKLIKIYIQEFKNQNLKYNIDAIQCCLNAGLENFLEKPFIALNYEEVSTAFPAYYL